MKALKISFKNQLSKIEWVLYVLFEFIFTTLYAGSARLMYTVSNPVLFGYYLGIITGDAFYLTLHVFQDN